LLRLFAIARVADQADLFIQICLKDLNLQNLREKIKNPLIPIAIGSGKKITNQ
jgi:hypothetical protein